MKKNFTKILTLVLIAMVTFSACRKKSEQKEITVKSQEDFVIAVPVEQGVNATRDNHLAMGNPSGAVTSTSSPSNYLLSKSQYVMSYHRDRGTPNWVSWHLSTAWLGSAARQDDFRADASLPTGWYRVGSTSYSGSGFDRGHLCPSADRTTSVTDNSATFFMTNMMPQAPRNNQQTWANLENYCRTLVNQGNELYVIAGQYGTGGNGSNGGTTSTLDAGRITVPSHTWKVIVVLPEGTNDVGRVTTATRVISVIVPNRQDISTSWGTYRTTVDNIEAIRSYNLLSTVPTTIQSVIESRVDAGPTS